MPKHPAFVDEYGRSASFKIKKRRKQGPRQIIVVDDSESDDADFCNTESSFSETDTENSVYSPSDQTHEDEDADEEDYRNDSASENDGGNSEAASDDLRFEDDANLEFNDDDEDSDEENEDDENRPLFDGSSITLGECTLAILSFVLCHNLTGSALGDLLVLINLICGQSCTLQTSLYLFRKHFANIRYPIVKHCYCSVCCSSLATSTALCETSAEHKGVSYFIEIPIIRQLQMLFDRPGFYDNLRYRLNRVKKNHMNREDIYDGDVYRELSIHSEFLSSPSNISFTWNTDGVAIFQSSGFQIWPFYLSINELSFRERTKPENILLGGLWFGPEKPLPNLFLKPINTALSEISDGVFFNVPNKERPVKIKGIVICGTCDLPAKALFLNMTQFNGRYGCPKCKLRGRSEGVWTYPFERQLLERTEEESREYAENAVRTDTSVFGIKGPSVLDLFVHQYIRTTAVDSMHCVFAGVVKKLCRFFFDTAFSDHQASLSRFNELVDSRLCTMTSPSFVQRRPRSIKRHLKYWKANELKAWLFYYSLPILSDIMSPDYFEHYCMFALAIYTLYQPSISAVMLEKATKLLEEFVNRFDVLYGKRYMSCNLHQLLHLPQTVRDFGPLWVTSCFPFEDLNGKLKRLVHSSRHPQLQICNAVSSFLNLSALRQKKLVPNTPVDLYCATLAGAKKKMRLQYVTEGIRIVGRCNDVKNLSEIVALALHNAGILGRKFKTFSRLIKDHSLYTSESYSRCIKYDNTCVRYQNNGSEMIGIIDSFVKVFDCVCHFENMCECYAPIYAIIRQCICSPVVPPDIRDGIPALVFECTSVVQEAEAVDIQQLDTLCFFLKINDLGKNYIAVPVNTIEVE